MAYITEDFLLHSETARRLYSAYAQDLPIIDYHNHLPVADLANDRRFGNLFEMALEGDHYKWRAMRAHGIEERYCTGDTDPYEKFLAWARTVPATVRNPLYQWTHLELSRYFGIDDLLNEATAPVIWERANEQLGSPELSALGILKKFRVAALCTTDDPADDLAHHRALNRIPATTRVYPAFRPDKALAIHQTDAFNAWLDRVGAAADVSISRLSDLLEALDRRHAAFHEVGCRLSDHGLTRCYADFPTELTASTIFDKARSGQPIGPDEHQQFASFLMLQFGRLDSRRGWTKQLHLGALRNARTRAWKTLGPDTGFDSIGDYPQAEALASYLDRLDCDDALPKVIVYNVNPADNYVLASMIGNFQGGIRGKIQFGSGWWYLDSREGMEWQINALSNAGLLSRFIGMLTDSRSFLSFPRHEYFRRVLCNVIGADVERGDIPNDDALLRPLIEDICFYNAREYLGLQMPDGLPATGGNGLHRGAGR